MTTTDVTKARVLRANEGARLGKPNNTDRFMIEGAASNGRVAVVEHGLTPGTIAAPMHRHTKEDEFSLVLEGRLGASLGGEVVYAEAGDLVFKPRDQWHTFWNAGDTPLRILEIISPAGLEEFFRLIDQPEIDQDPERIAEMSAEIGIDVDQDATARVVEEHGLHF
jgi:uncharacterized cupin superfamily protein